MSDNLKTIRELVEELGVSKKEIYYQKLSPKAGWILYHFKFRVLQ